MEKYISTKKFFNVEPNVIFEVIDGFLINKTYNLQLELGLIQTPYFKKYENPNIELIVSNDIEEDDDVVELNWKMEVKFKTTKKKMYEVQKFIYENIEKIL